MPDSVTFHFEGALADNHTLDFYEASRFQYAAARLIVKLNQFRSTGSFVKRITSTSNSDVLLRTQRDGSFDISVLLPIIQAAQDSFIKVSIPNLMSYVFERVVGRTSNSDVAKALNQSDNIVSILGKMDDNKTDLINKALEMIQTDQAVKQSLHDETKELYERRIAELTRENDLSRNQSQFNRIDPAREQKLISMSAPLVGEMATALRRSAKTLQIYANDNGIDRNILYLNRGMAEEIELSRVDEDVTLILVDIIQYNKETGWGKAKVSDINQYIGFNIPSDIKNRIQSQLLSAMEKDKVYIQTYIVRDKSGTPSRLIIVGILPTPTE